MVELVVYQSLQVLLDTGKNWELRDYQEKQSNYSYIRHSGQGEFQEKGENGTADVREQACWQLHKDTVPVAS